MRYVTNTVLINGQEKEVTGFGQIIKNDQPVSYHSALDRRHHNERENSKFATSGHIYVVNYNPKTYKKGKIETFEQFRENGYKF